MDKSIHETSSMDTKDILDGILERSILEHPLDHKSINKIVVNKEVIQGLEKEDIQYLFEKILMSSKPSNGIRLLEKSGILEILIPELQKCVGFDQKNPHHNYDVFDHILAVLDHTPKELVLRWAALLHDVAKPITFFLDKNKKSRFFGHDIKGAQLGRKILTRIGYEENFIREVVALIETHMSRYNMMKEKGIKKLIAKVGEENIEKLFELQRADIKGRHGPHDFTKVDAIENMVKQIINSKEHISY